MTSRASRCDFHVRPICSAFVREMPASLSLPGFSSRIWSVCIPNASTSFCAVFLPMPLTSPLDRYRARPLSVRGASSVTASARTCSPCFLSISGTPRIRTSAPLPVFGKCPMTVTGSARPAMDTFTTRNVESSRSNVTRSTSPSKVTSVGTTWLEPDIVHPCTARLVGRRTTWGTLLWGLREAHRAGRCTSGAKSSQPVRRDGAHVASASRAGAGSSSTAAHRTARLRCVRCGAGPRKVRPLWRRARRGCSSSGPGHPLGPAAALPQVLDVPEGVAAQPCRHGGPLLLLRLLARDVFRRRPVEGAHLLRRLGARRRVLGKRGGLPSVAERLRHGCGRWERRHRSPHRLARRWRRHLLEKTLDIGRTTGGLTLEKGGMVIRADGMRTRACALEMS